MFCAPWFFLGLVWFLGPFQLTRGGFEFSALKHRYRIPLTLPHQQIPLKPAGVPMFDPTTDSATYSHATPIARSKSPASLVDRPGVAARSVAGSSSVQTSSPPPPPPPRSMGQGTGMHFDPLMIARRDDGWETALQNTLETWLGAVCKELGSGDTTR